MWKNTAFIYRSSELFNLRTYIRRAGSLVVKRPHKILKGRLKSKQQEESIDIRSQRREIQKSQEYVEDPEGFGDFESDFMDVHKSHREYLAEARQYKEQIRHWVVKNKYFNEKQPNFLTYSEKEQIKLLNSRDPDEWTPEKLSDSFPADPATISKILKAKWVANSEKRVKLHDRSVIKNWKLFKQGQIDLDKDLLEHLQKFANRTSIDLESTKTSERAFSELPVPKCSEFVSIITSCKKYKDDTKLIEDQKQLKDTVGFHSGGFEGYHAEQNETFLMGKVSNSKPIRLEELKESKLGNLKEVNDSYHSESHERTNIPQFNEEKFVTSEPKEIIISQSDMKTYEVSAIKEKIHIPRKIWRRGATYKVEDCYYDDDGEFLYRIPGMTGRRI